VARRRKPKREGPRGPETAVALENRNRDGGWDGHTTEAVAEGVCESRQPARQARTRWLMPPEAREQCRTESRVPVTRGRTVETMTHERVHLSPQGRGEEARSGMERRHGRSGARRWTWLAPQGAGTQRPSGNDRKATGRGDTDRLLARGKLRRVSHRAEGDWDEEVEANSFVEASPPGARQTR
jgi:hypothetical protein